MSVVFINTQNLTSYNMENTENISNLIYLLVHRSSLLDKLIIPINAFYYTLLLYFGQESKHCMQVYLLRDYTYLSIGM